MTGVRRASVEDAAACAGIVHNWLESKDWLESPGLSALTDLMTAGIPRREFWVIGAPAEGYMSIDPAEALIHGFYVARPGIGHGKALMDYAKAGRDYLQLWTHEANTAAHRFYHREGFMTVERKAEGRGDGVPELRMEWRR
ncbi:MAG: GNAT family N-acetyltransferase [Shimia sp.]